MSQAAYVIFNDFLQNVVKQRIQSAGDRPRNETRASDRARQAKLLGSYAKLYTNSAQNVNVCNLVRKGQHTHELA